MRFSVSVKATATFSRIQKTAVVLVHDILRMKQRGYVYERH